MNEDENESETRQESPSPPPRNPGIRPPIDIRAFVEWERRKPAETELLLAEAKQALPRLRALLEIASDDHLTADAIYRFYHGSYKAFGIQRVTLDIVDNLQGLAPHLELNAQFRRIISQGTGKHYTTCCEEDWERDTRAILEAFVHAKHMLAMVCKYADELETPPQAMPVGWATVLYLYNLR